MGLGSNSHCPDGHKATGTFTFYQLLILLQQQFSVETNDIQTIQ